jgi:2'-5' RNA ligase
MSGNKFEYCYTFTMEFSQSADWVGKPYEGYVVNAEFSDENKAQLQQLIQEMQQILGNAAHCMPPESLHITLLDWIAPLVDYDGADKAGLFEQIKPEYDAAMSEAIASVGQPIEIHFDELRVSPSTIFITGRDNGEFQKIRDEFVERIQLLPDTKRPPQIVHSSLARFTDRISLDGINAFIARHNLDMTQRVDDFRLVHTMREPMLEFEILKRYHLGK